MALFAHPEEKQTLVGEVIAIYFESDSSFYKVLRVEIDPHANEDFYADEMTVTGNFVSLHLGTTYEFTGAMTTHPRYGEQFAVTSYQQQVPTSAEGLIDYLSSPRFKGIGPVLAQRIVDNFGADNVIDQILHDPDGLKDIPGLSATVRNNLHATLMAHQGAERIYLQLNEWGFSSRLSDTIYQLYQEDTLQKIKANPYELIEKVSGIGFARADQLARQLGIQELATERLQAALYTATMTESYRNGSTYVQEQALLIEARQLLEDSRHVLIEDETLQEALELAIFQDQLKRLHDGIMIPSLYYAETGIALNIDDFLNHEESIDFADEQLEAAIDQVEAITHKTYDDQQRAALKLTINAPMSIVTGGPGTGKTTLVEGMIQLYALLHDLDLSADQAGTPDILLAAPTGRAAKRMNEMADLPAATIHRLIGYHRESHLHQFVPEELVGRLLIVDEMSMVDTWLMNWLTQAIPPSMQVVFVGDQDQLPSVSPGKVFNDLIASGVIPTIQLEKIYRQAEGSSIVHLAHAIRQGRLPADFTHRQSDRSFIAASTQQIAPAIEQITRRAIEQGYTAETLQVLAPMYRGVAGINALNHLLQEVLNPTSAKKHEVNHFDTVFRVGDKVLQNVNNPDDQVYNGDIGFITSVVPKGVSGATSDEIIVEFDEGQEVTYHPSDWDQLTLAYCTSIHKAQGSEYPLVILPMVGSYSRMLRRDLLYTAITRASEKLILLGNPDSYYQAVTSQSDTRQTFLKDLLKVKFHGVAVTTDSKRPEASKERDLSGSTTSTLSAADPLSFESAESLSLTMENVHRIDAMIGMEGIAPEDFMI